MKKSNIIKTVVVITAFVLIFVMADIALYPCTFIRNDIHAVATKSYDDIFIGTSHGKMGI